MSDTSYKSVTSEEVDHADARENSDSNTVRIHDVTYHKRRLLPGQRASERAQQLTLDVIYNLPFSYTFVKPQQRGAGPGKVTGHTF